MKFIDLKTKSEETEILSPFVLCLGNFDGVHLGHRQLIKEAVKFKNDHPNVKCGAWLFENLSSKSAKPIFSTEQKLEAFSKLGLDYAFIADFHSVRSLSPEVFVNEVLKSECRCVHAICGENFRFGAKASANAHDLVSLMGKNATVVPLLKSDGEVVSSTLIRSLLELGEIEKANLLLGDCYSVCEPVLHGKALGRTLGIPTINQSLPDDRLILKGGIYATVCYIDEKKYAGVTNVGVRPTVEDSTAKNIETHIIGFSDYCYGKRVKTEFYTRIRDEIKFSSVDELKDQITKDIDTVKEYFKSK